MTTYQPLTVTECTRCGSPVLRGTVAGCDVRLSRFTVPARHAAVIEHYRAGAVFVVTRRVEGRRLWADWFSAAVYRPAASKWIALSHECGGWK